MNLAPSSQSSSADSPNRTQGTHRGRLVLFIAVLIVIGSLSAGAAWSWNATQGDRLVPGITILGTSVGGRSPREAQEILERAIQERWHKGVEVRFQGKTVSLGTPTYLITYNIQETIAQAKKLGRTGSLATRLIVPMATKIFGYRLEPTASVEQAALKERVTRTLGSELHEHRDARLIVEASDTTSTIRVEPDEAGISINIETLAQGLRNAALSGEDAPIALETIQEAPTITSADLTPLIPTAEAWLKHAPIALGAEDIHWSVKRGELASWIRVTTSTNPFTLTLDEKSVASHLRLHTKDLLKPVHDGRIALGEDGKATAFEAPEEGVDVDASTTIKNILDGWQAGSSTIAVVLARVEPKILGDGERLGIHEIVGVGRSMFAGSPANRRKNIALGAKKVGMTLVPPNEEFSMLKTLGMIDGEHGWLPELVIKGNKTTPEFGGGLCQVGTTMFRAALAGGFPITERRNHSYRVRYYEPAGTDATIYDPAPDFKFKNDLTGWILITTRVQGDSLVFTVWGKKDGRKVEQTASKVFNIVPAPPKKTIETLDLKPGQEKCTETAHAGADAQFDYTVTYPDGKAVKKTFFSRYKPWQAVCLKGVEKLTQPVDGVDETGVNNPNL